MSRTNSEKIFWNFKIKYVKIFKGHPIDVVLEKKYVENLWKIWGIPKKNIQQVLQILETKKVKEYLNKSPDKFM